MSNPRVSILIEAIDRATNVVRNIRDSLNNLGDSANAVSRVKQSMQEAEGASKALFGTVAAGAAVLGGTAAMLIKNGIASKAFMHDSEIAFTTFLGSGEKAKGFLDELYAFAKTTPFQFPDLITASRNMVAFGMNSADVIPTLGAIGDAVASIGGGQEELLSLSQAFSDMQVSGKVSMDAINRLSANGVQALQILANEAGVSTDDMRKKISSGSVDSENAIKTLVKGIQEGSKGMAGETVAMGGMMAGLKGTFTGAADSMKGAWRRLGEAFVTDDLYAGVVETMGKITGVLNQLPAILEPVAAAISSGFSSMVTHVETFATAIANMPTGALVAAFSMIAGAILVGMVPALTAMATAAWAALAPLLPWLAAGAAIGALAYMIISNWESFAPFFETTFALVKMAVDGFKEGFQVAFDLLVAGITPLWEAIKELLISIMPIIEAIGVILGVLLVIAISVFNGVVAAVAPLVTAVVNLLSIFTNVIMGIVALITGDFSGAMKHFRSAAKSAADFFKNIWTAVKGFFTGFVSSVVGIFKGFGVDIVATFKNMFTRSNSESSGGLNRIVSTITGFAGKMLKSGMGLLTAFTDGIKKGFSKAVDAVKGGMDKIRGFFPFSDAKEGPLSDLTKSGTTLFPTFANGFSDGVRAARNAARKGMVTVKNELDKEANMSLGFGASQNVILHKYEFDEMAISLEGGFDGLTPEERRLLIDAIKNGLLQTMSIDALKQQIRKR